MDSPAPKVTPIYGSGSGLRGSIAPAANWRIEGEGWPNVLALDSGRLGRGPMHIKFDGVVVQTFAKPSRATPWTQSQPILVGGHQILVYAESRDFGDSIRCDIYVDGVSVIGHKPLADIRAAGSVAAAASAEYTSPFDSMRMARQSVKTTVWLAPLLASGRVVGVSQLSTMFAAAALGLCFALIWGVAFAAWRLLSKGGPKQPHRRLIALAVVSLCYFADIAVLVGVLGGLLHVA